MKRIFWPTMLLALLAPHAASLAQEQPLICFGNEPSWRLDLPGAGKASFSTPDASAVDYAGAAITLTHRGETVWRGRPVDAEGGELVAFLREGPCSDQMSDTSHPYSVNVSLPDGRHLAGCCRLSEAPAAVAGLEHGPWLLAELAGVPLPAGQGQNAVTVNFEAGRVHGFSGCNQFMGPYRLDGGRLVLGPIGGTMMATGSAYTAQIGTMRVTEEIDALRSMGIGPMELLVLPKLLALLIALPLLTVYADVMGMLGGMVMANAQLGIAFATFIDRLGVALTLDSYLVGVGKAPVFAAIIATLGCYQGFRVAGSAESVGQRTTRSVVQSILAVIVVDAAFSVAFSYLGI